MFLYKIAPIKKPELSLQLSWHEAEELRTMINEAKAYASECGESTKLHDEFVAAMDEVLVG